MAFETQNNAEQLQSKDFPDQDIKELFDNLQADPDKTQLHTFAKELNDDLKNSPVAQNPDQRKNDVLAGISIMNDPTISQNPQLQTLAKQILLKIDTIPQSYMASEFGDGKTFLSEYLQVVNKKE